MKSIKEVIQVLSINGSLNPSITEIIEYSKKNGVELNKTELLSFLNKNHRNTGAYYLPEGLSTFIAELVDFYNPSSLLNICSGYGEILSKCKGIQEIKGIELNKELVTISSYLNPDVNFEIVDPLEINETKKYDVVTSFPPTGRINDSNRPLDELYIEKGLNLLNPNGVGVFLVTTSFLNSIRTQKFRNNILNKYNLNSIISLKSDSFSHTAIELSIIILIKNKRERTNFYRNESYNKTIENFKLEKVDFSVYKDRIRDRWDYPFHNPRNYEYENTLSKFQTKRIEELVEIVKGRVITSNIQSDIGDYLILSPMNLKDGQLIITEKNRYINKEILSNGDKNAILKKGDIILSKNINDKLSFNIYNDDTGKYIINQNLIILRGNNINYVTTFLKTEEGEKLLNAQLKRHNLGSIFPLIPIQDLKKVQIPILPIDDFEVASEKVLNTFSKNELFNLHSSYETIKRSIRGIDNEKNNLKYHTILLEELTKKVDLVLKNQYNIDLKLDIIISSLRDLSEEFKQIKELPRDEEEKVFKLCQSIDQKMTAIYNEQTSTIENYIEEIKRWMFYWDLLDVQSQKFLPIAEFLFDKLNVVPQADYSPFIVEYCRALENEILKKLFESYHSIGLKDVDREELVKNDLDHKFVGKFALMVKTNRQTYTLGDMSFIMSFLKKDGSTLKNSLLLQHFREFTIHYFAESIVEKDFLDNVKQLTNEFRNKAAHPYTLELEQAKQCQVLLRSSLNAFMESINKNHLINNNE